MSEEELIKKLRSNYKKISSSGLLNLADLEALPKTSGVYMVYRNNSVVYVGSTKNLRRRTRNFLKRVLEKHIPKGEFKHTLNTKLFKLGTLTPSFYSRCSFRVLETKDIYEARLLEQLLISIFKPRYND
jgi:excinuclease UvrABC nuclease subunit